MTSFWCELAWLGGPQPQAGVLIEVHDGLISSVLAGGPAPPPEAVRLSGLTLPGLANAHSHAFQRALRGRTHAVQGTFWTWREQMYALAGSLGPDHFALLTRAVFEEMALAGITLVGEFHYVHGDGYEELVLEAAQAVGLRITLLDTCYLHGGLPVFRDSSAQAWAERVDALRPGPRARIGAAIHSVRAVDPEAASLVAGWASVRASPLHAHVSEQPGENEWCHATHGCTPTELLAGAGALDARFTAVHFTHVTPTDLELLAAARGRVCLCPTTERDLADGVGRARDMRAAGIGLALGSDSNAIIEPFEEARAVELDERLVTGVRGGHPGHELLGAATHGGYESLGWPGGGRLAVGAPADLIAVSTNGARLADIPPEHLIDGLVFAGAAADVTDVIVAGEFIVRQGRLMR